MTSNLIFQFGTLRSLALLRGIREAGWGRVLIVLGCLGVCLGALGGFLCFLLGIDLLDLAVITEGLQSRPFSNNSHLGVR